MRIRRNSDTVTAAFMDAWRCDVCGRKYPSYVPTCAFCQETDPPNPTLAGHYA